MQRAAERANVHHLTGSKRINKPFVHRRFSYQLHLLRIFVAGAAVPISFSVFGIRSSFATAVLQFKINVGVTTVFMQQIQMLRCEISIIATDVIAVT